MYMKGCMPEVISIDRFDEDTDNLFRTGTHD